MRGYFISFRFLLGSLLALFAAKPAQADRLDDLIRIHIEAIGGSERVTALKAMRARGFVLAGGQKVHFSMMAERPNRIRVETERAGRTLVQAFDGQAAAWEFDTGTWPPQYRDMPAAVAKTFTNDAEFDDPLVAGRARGYTFDYAGEIEGEGKKLIRILATRRLVESFSLLLDPDTFFIVRRIEERTNRLGQPVFVVTQFADYRPVAGVLIPHVIALVEDGQLKQRTQIEAVDPNPEITAETFARPVTVTTGKR